MLLESIKPLKESVDFHASEFHEDKGYHSGRYNKVTKDCEACEGKGKGTYDDETYDCGYCKATGKYDTEEIEVPEIKKTMTVYGFGLGASKINQYIDALLELMDYAQKHNMNISWA